MHIFEIFVCEISPLRFPDMLCHLVHREVFGPAILGNIYDFFELCFKICAFVKHALAERVRQFLRPLVNASVI